MEVSMAVAIARTDLSARELRAAAAKGKDAKVARRMLAIALVLEGMDRRTAAETCGIDRHGRVVVFDGLEFGLAIARNGGVPETHRLPPPGVACRSTDQDLLTALHVRWQPDDVVVLDVRITNAGITRSAHGTASPCPARPFPSWTWGGNGWAAPVPYPDDGGWYDWDDGRGVGGGGGGDLTRAGGAVLRPRHPRIARFCASSQSSQAL
jgi:hypothetical protein